MKLHIWKSANNDWYWTLRARNGRKVAIGGEGYRTRAKLLRTLYRLFAENRTILDQIIKAKEGV